MSAIHSDLAGEPLSQYAGYRRPSSPGERVVDAPTSAFYSSGHTPSYRVSHHLAGHGRRREPPTDGRILQSGKVEK